MNQTATAQKKKLHIIGIFTAVIHTVQHFFTRIKQKCIEAAYFKQMKKQYGKNAARLALSSCSWVELYWNGNKQPFLIKNIAFQELLTCGRFPNILFQFTKTISKKLGIEDEAVQESDIQKMQEEEEEFRHELAEKSMVYPRYRECYEAIIGILGNTEARREDVMPKDFINDLFLWYVSDWYENIKKKSELLALNESAALQNTGNAPQAAILPD